MRSMDEATRARYEAREAWLRDEATRQYEAENRGWKKDKLEGRAEGRMEGKIEGEINKNVSNAVSLLDVLDDATIAKKLSLPTEMVERLRDGDVEGVKAELLERSNRACKYPW